MPLALVLNTYIHQQHQSAKFSGCLDFMDAFVLLEDFYDGAVFNHGTLPLKTLFILTTSASLFVRLRVSGWSRLTYMLLYLSLRSRRYRPWLEKMILVFILIVTSFPCHIRLLAVCGRHVYFCCDLCLLVTSTNSHSFSSYA